MEGTTDNHGEPSDGEIGDWLRASAEELQALIAGERREEEDAFQDWLERHPAFVPGSRGPSGMSSHTPWPSALISQPRLTGIAGKQPDFCWLAADSASLTVMMIEIETPAKGWQRRSDGGQKAELTQALDQIASWRVWFAEDTNKTRFLSEYRVPDRYRRLQFRQQYILVHGSRAEYAADEVRTRLRAAQVDGDGLDALSFDRLAELGTSEAAIYGCVKRQGTAYQAVAVPPFWWPERLDDDALLATEGLPDAVTESEMPEGRKVAALGHLEELGERQAETYRYKPPATP